LSPLKAPGKLPGFMERVNIGRLGGGTVGSGVFHAMQQNAGLLSARIGMDIAIRRVAVKAFDEPRPYPITRSALTTDWQSVVQDPENQVIVELVGGTTLAKTMVLAALELGKPVVTANKALLSAHGEELFAAAAKHGTNLYYEASVCGGIPIIKSLREGLVGNRITHLYGIVNGTCNYILSRMTAEGADFASVLADAQRQGYAEAEPSLDVDGYDAQHKIGILASLAHGFWVDPQRIHVEGIRQVTALDIRFAAKLGYAIKLLGIIKALPPARSGRSRVGSRIQVSIYPALIPQSHVMASVGGVFNAVLVRGDVVGDTLFYGRGAGKDATASAVLSDLADAALDLKFDTRHRLPPFVSHERAGSVAPIEEVTSRYFLRLQVVDRPGVMAAVAKLLAAERIGISSIIQPEGHEGEAVPIILMIHDATNRAMMRALARIAKLKVVKAAPVMFRVEDFR